MQREYFVQWQTEQRGKFTDVPHLDTVIRPQLDQLTAQILRQLALTWPALVDTREQPRIAQAMQKLSSTKLSADAVTLAVKPLIDGSAL